jgi:hypothetical protein
VKIKNKLANLTYRKLVVFHLDDNIFYCKPNLRQGWSGLFELSAFSAEASSDSLPVRPLNQTFNY